MSSFKCSRYIDSLLGLMLSFVDNRAQEFTSSSSDAWELDLALDAA